MSVTDRLQIIDADITTLDVDAIVNAANEQLAAGGGVCGAIHHAAGPELAHTCAALTQGLGPCKTGEARVTPGFDLPASHVIHAVGPVWHGGGAGEPALLAAAYVSSLKVLVENDLKTIAFPAISTGIFGYPPDQAADVAVHAVARFVAGAPHVNEVIFCCFGPDSVQHHRQALATL